MGLSYRLEPENAKHLFTKLNDLIHEYNIDSKFFFGGTPAVCELAEKQDYLQACLKGQRPKMKLLIKFSKGKKSCSS